MKRITLLFLLFFTQFIFAQFNANDVKYYVGSGTETAYFIIDFKDGTDDCSYAWGYRYNVTDNPSAADMLEDIAAEEPNLTIDITGGYLKDIIFNSHSGIDSNPDWWSIWCGGGTSSSSLLMGGGIVSSQLQNGLWYGVSYGFMNPTSEHPATPIPAYSSQWYDATDIITWLGTGSNQSVIVIDFGTDTANIADSYAFGIRYNGTITAEDALDLIVTELNGGFDYVISSTDIASVTIGSRTETAAGTIQWSTYSGTDLSNWKTENNLSIVTLDNNDWLGLSFGTRRPFIPQDITASLSTKSFNQIKVNVYPNPTSDVLNIDTTENIDNVIVYNLSGQKVLQTNTQPTVNVSSLNAGVYLLEVQTEKGTGIMKFVKK